MQAADGDGDVVDGAEAFAMVGVGVMEAAADVGAEAIAKRGLRGEDGAAGSEPDRLYKFWGIRDLELHDVAGGERGGL